MNLLFLAIPAVLLAASLVFTKIIVKKGTPVRKAMAIHLLSLIAMVVLCVALPIGASADSSTANSTQQTTQSAQEAAATSSGLKYIGAALAVGLAAVGGGIAVAAGAPAAIGANVEDPKSFGKSLIFVALGEGFGLYGLLVGILCLVLK